MKILGLDTATCRASVGIWADGAIVAERSQLADASHAVSLLPLVDAVLEEARCRMNDLDAVAVSTGPGSFTGLRVGLSVAKGLAYATDLDVVAVPTLAALARTVADRTGVIAALLDARKGEIYAAWFESSSVSGLRRLTDDLLLTPETLIERLPVPCTVLGDAVAVYGPVLQQRLGEGVTLLPFDAFAPRGGVVAAMGAERLREGTGDQLPDLEPSYIRRPEAELKSLAAARQCS